MNYLLDFHWVWYGIGFLVCPKITIMIVLSIYLKNFIPLPLMILGWISAIFGSVQYNKGEK